MGLLKRAARGSKLRGAKVGVFVGANSLDADCLRVSFGADESGLVRLLRFKNSYGDKLALDLCKPIIVLNCV